MPGTVRGGKKAAKTNKKLYGKDFYKELGRKGGATLTNKPKGFAANPELARIVGAIGGMRSKRGPAKDKDKKEK